MKKAEGMKLDAQELNPEELDKVSGGKKVAELIPMPGKKTETKQAATGLRSKLLPTEVRDRTIMG
jgi:hypothetical protein